MPIVVKCLQSWTKNFAKSKEIKRNWARPEDFDKRSSIKYIRKIFRKSNINISFSENFAYVLNGGHQLDIS